MIRSIICKSSCMVSSLVSSIVSGVSDAVAIAVFTSNSDETAGSISNDGETIHANGTAGVFFSGDELDQNLVDGGVYGYNFTMDLSAYGNNTTAYIGFGNGSSTGGGGLTESLAMALVSDDSGNLELQVGTPFVPEFKPATAVSLSYAGEVMSIVTSTTGGTTNCKIYQGDSLIIDENLSSSFSLIDRLLVYATDTSGDQLTLTLSDTDLPSGVTRVTVTS